MGTVACATTTIIQVSVNSVAARTSPGGQLEQSSDDRGQRADLGSRKLYVCTVQVFRSVER